MSEEESSNSRDMRCCFDSVRHRRVAMLKTIFIISVMVVAVSAQVEEMCDLKFESVQNNTDFVVDDVKVVACRSTGCESLSDYENIYQVVKKPANKTSQIYCMKFVCLSRPREVCIKSNNITLNCTHFTDKNITEIEKQDNLHTKNTAKKECPTSSNQSLIAGVVSAGVIIVVLTLVIIVIIYKWKNSESDLSEQLRAANQENSDQRQKFQEEYVPGKETRKTALEKTREDESTSGLKAFKSSYKDQKSTIPETVGLVLSRQSEVPNPGTTSTNDDQDIQF